MNLRSNNAADHEHVFLLEVVSALAAWLPHRMEWPLMKLLRINVRGRHAAQMKGAVVGFPPVPALTSGLLQSNGASC